MKKDKYLQFEREKSKLQAQNLTPAEYEAKIREICKRLGI